jgi:hypothetical protein
MRHDQSVRAWHQLRHRGRIVHIHQLDVRGGAQNIALHSDFPAEGLALRIDDYNQRLVFHTR